MKRINWILVALTALGFAQGAAAVQPLEMDNAIVIEAADPLAADQLVVTGRNFDNGQTIQLTLGGTPLPVLEHTATVILAEIPADVLPGSYVLVVWSGGGSVREDSMDITVGAEGPAGETGPQGPEGPQGPQGIQGPEGPAGPQGEQGLQGLRGEQGPQGETGAAGANGINGADGQDGANCYDGIVDGTSVEDCMGPPGPKGDKGDKGEQGDQGPPGTAPNSYVLSAITFSRASDGAQNARMMVYCDPGDELINVGYIASPGVIVDRLQPGRFFLSGVPRQSAEIRAERFSNLSFVLSGIVTCADTAPGEPVRDYDLQNTVTCTAPGPGGAKCNE